MISVVIKNTAHYYANPRSHLICQLSCKMQIKDSKNFKSTFQRGQGFYFNSKFLHIKNDNRGARRKSRRERLKSPSITARPRHRVGREGKNKVGDSGVSGTDESGPFTSSVARMAMTSII